MEEAVQYLKGVSPYVTKDKKLFQPIFKFVYRSPSTGEDMHNKMLQYVKEEYPDLLTPIELVDTRFPKLFSTNGESRGYINFMVIPNHLLHPGLFQIKNMNTFLNVTDISYHIKGEEDQEELWKWNNSISQFEHDFEDMANESNKKLVNHYKKKN